MVPLSKHLPVRMSRAAFDTSADASTNAGTLPGPTPNAGLPELYAARTSPMPPVARITAVRLLFMPASVPSIVAGLRISAGLGWQSLVGAELIVASSGIGYLMVKGQSAISTATVMCGMIAIGVVGYAIDALLRAVEAHIHRRRGRNAR